MRWGTPKEYAWLHKVSGSTYQNALMFWLQTENPQLFELTKKEIARDRNGHTSAGSVQKRGRERGNTNASGSFPALRVGEGAGYGEDGDDSPGDEVRDAQG